MIIMYEQCVMFRTAYVILSVIFFFFKQKTAYEMRISDWSSDVCSSDLGAGAARGGALPLVPGLRHQDREERAGGRSHLGVRQWPPMAMLETPWRFESSQPHHALFRTGQPRGPITASAPASRPSTFRDDEDPDPGLLHTADRKSTRLNSRH